MSVTWPAARRGLCVAMAATAACTGVGVAASRPVDSRLHVGKGIGAAHVGMTTSAVAKALHARPTQPITHERPEGRYRVRHVGVLVVAYDPDTLRVTLVSTRSRRFHYRGLHVGSSKATVLRRLAGKGWRHLTCRGTQFDVAYYPGKPLDSPVGRIPTARAEFDLADHAHVQGMTAGADSQLISSSQCDDTAL